MKAHLRIIRDVYVFLRQAQKLDHYEILSALGASHMSWVLLRFSGALI